MERYSAILIAQWLLSLWLLGWIALPYSRRIFTQLPDGGLAAGRVLSLVFFGLLAFWLGSFHIIALTWMPRVLWCLLVVLSVTHYWPLRNRQTRQEFSAWLHARRRALLVSDLIFIGTFLFFVFLRLCRPEINDLEKPMDCAIIGSLARTEYLPALNPWFAGSALTNYYYFGHLMGALLKRIFDTPLPYAYNLIQPAFCAFFVSTLWALCAALCHSLARGAIAVFLVAFCGNFEPLRQFYFQFSQKGLSALSLANVDWWSTSRVIPHTINEYPFFTMAIGDAHAHFFALSIAALILSTCHELVFFVRDTKTNEDKSVRMPLLRARARNARILMTMGIAGCLLGAMIMTNTWDVPLYSAIIFISSLLSIKLTGEFKAQRLSDRMRNFGLACCPLLIAAALSSPFLWSYHPPIGGLRFELWPVPPDSFLLIWSGFLLLWLFFTFQRISGETRSYVEVTGAGKAALNANFLSAVRLIVMLLLLVLLSFIWNILLPIGVLILWFTALRNLLIMPPATHPAGSRNKDSFLYLIGSFGLLALLFPFLFYLQGFFGGDLRHQDTVFKFGLQSWLLLGTGSACAFLRSQRSSQFHNKANTKRQNLLIAILYAVVLSIWIISLTGTLAVSTARSTNPSRAPSDLSKSELTLNGAKGFSDEEQKAILWLERMAPKNTFLIEAVGRDPEGNFVAAYSDFGRISTLTGIPSYIGWPQHAGFWGAEYSDIHARLLRVEALYRRRDAAGIRTLTNSIAREISKLPRELPETLLYVGDTETATYGRHLDNYLLSGYKQIYPSLDQSGNALLPHSPRPAILITR